MFSHGEYLFLLGTSWVFDAHVIVHVEYESGTYSITQ